MKLHISFHADTPIADPTHSTNGFNPHVQQDEWHSVVFEQYYSAGKQSAKIKLRETDI